MKQRGVTEVVHSINSAIEVEGQRSDDFGNMVKKYLTSLFSCTLPEQTSFLFVSYSMLLSRYSLATQLMQ